MAEDPTDAEISNAAAITGAFIGIYVLDNLLTAGILAGLAAYATTTDSKVGDFVKSSGECCVLRAARAAAVRASFPALAARHGVVHDRMARAAAW